MVQLIRMSEPRKSLVRDFGVNVASGVAVVLIASCWEAVWRLILRMWGGLLWLIGYSVATPAWIYVIIIVIIYALYLRGTYYKAKVRCLLIKDLAKLPLSSSAK